MHREGGRKEAEMSFAYTPKVHHTSKINDTFVVKILVRFTLAGTNFFGHLERERENATNLTQE